MASLSFHCFTPHYHDMGCYDFWTHRKVKEKSIHASPSEILLTGNDQDYKKKSEKNITYYARHFSPTFTTGYIFICYYQPDTQIQQVYLLRTPRICLVFQALIWIMTFSNKYRNPKIYNELLNKYNCDFNALLLLLLFDFNKIVDNWIKQTHINIANIKVF